MGRRGFRYQPADERRTVHVPAAGDFGAAVVERYRRTSLFGASVATVLRRVVAPIRIEHRAHVDARTTNLFARLERAGVLDHERHRSAAVPVVTHLAERTRRLETARGGDSPVLRDSRPSAPAHAPAPAVAMVLTRPPAAPESPRASSAPPWPDVPDVNQHGRTARPWTDTVAGVSRMDVRQLTDRVMDALDRRLSAARERLGA